MKKYLWGIIFSVILTGAVTYTLLDAFVIERVYDIPPPLVMYSPTTAITEPIIDTSMELPTIVSPEPTFAATAESLPIMSPEPTEPTVITEPNDPPPVVEAIITDWSYIDNNISIIIERLEGYGTVYYLAEVKISSAAYLKAAFAKGQFGRNITEKTFKMATDNNAIFAVNGDFYGFRDEGLIIRNGVFYRNTARVDHHSNEALLIDMDGNFSIAVEGVITNEDLAMIGVWHGFSFGPALVIGGKTVADDIELKRDPRTAVGQAGPLHYIFIVSEGRIGDDPTDKGMNLPDLAEIFIERGCHTAYNLDGGGSATMWFNGRTIYTNYDRSISDIIYIPRSIN